MKNKISYLFLEWSQIIFKTSLKNPGQLHLTSLFFKCFMVSGLFLIVSCQDKEPQTNLAATNSTILDYPIQPVPFTSVQIRDQFWTPRLETNRKVTLPYNFKKCEETGRIRNFAIAGGMEEGQFEGIYFNDSDVFKVIEGASYSLQVHDDPELKSYLYD